MWQRQQYTVAFLLLLILQVLSELLRLYEAAQPGPHLQQQQ